MTSTVRRWRWNDPLEVLVRTLGGDGMLAIPTESSYGLAVDPRSAAAVATVFSCKGRPPDKPLPMVLGELDQLRQLGGDPDTPGLAALSALWPGPVSVVVPIRHPLPATAGHGSVAVRVPAHPRLRGLLQRLQLPLTATSANRAGSPPVSDPEELLRLLAGWPVVLVDDGPLPGGLPSTIVQLGEDGLRVLREGAISSQRLRELLPMPVFSAGAAEIPADQRLPNR